MRTVSPLFIVALASAPAASNSFTTPPLPFEHATASGGMPYRFTALTLAPARTSNAAVAASS
jgi:hypothetical protein